MFLRKISQEIPHPSPPEEAFEDARQALLLIGTLKSADPDSATLRGSVAGGGWITLEVRATAAEGGSLLTLVGRCDDIWGAGARRGIDRFRQALRQGGGLGNLVRPRSIVKTPASLEDNLTLAQKLCVGAFFGLASIGSLDVAWGRGLIPLSLGGLLLASAAGGSLTGLVLNERRYWVVGLVGGAVTGLGAVGFSVLAFREMTYTYKLVAAVTTAVGCVPGVAVYLAVRRLQDRLFPPMSEPTDHPVPPP